MRYEQPMLGRYDGEYMHNDDPSYCRTILRKKKYNFVTMIVVRLLFIPIPFQEFSQHRKKKIQVLFDNDKATNFKCVITES